MLEYWQQTLYPLGFLASLLFGLRFILQWIESEKKKESTSSSLFWNFSLIANFIMLAHGLLQMQYIVCFVQASNSVIAFRNLQLLKKKETTHSFVKTLLLLAALLSLTTMFFAWESHLLTGEILWFRSPKTPWSQTTITLNPFWNSLGFIGSLLFTARFWWQWKSIEKERKSVFNKGFWLMSIWGSLLSLIYFTMIQDLVNIVSCSLGLVPYIRNTILLYQQRIQKPQSAG